MKHNKAHAKPQTLLKRIGLTHCSLIMALILAIVLNVASFVAKAETTVQDAQPLSSQIEDLKKALITLNRDLFILEEDLLFPSSSQLAVYLSVDVGTFFTLDAVELKIDDEVATHYLYTERQINALHRGGVQRLYLGNIPQGEHELTAFFVGIGPENRPYKRAVSIQFEKDNDPQAVELQIVDSPAKQQPEFSAVVL